MLNAEAIANRAVGQYPISIATSLALESANGVHPEIIVHKPPILRFNELWINTRTLYRNFLGALDKDTVKAVLPFEVAEGLAQEMEQITTIMGDSAKGQLKVIFYLSHYDGLAKKYPHALFRIPTTDRQHEYAALESQTLQILMSGSYIRAEFSLGLTPANRPRAMILTHIAYDLVSNPKFDELVLLESHTGKIKERPQWYTKYYNGKDMPNMPFREDLLTVFGDSETFRPIDHKLRKELIELANKYKWTSVTTYDKILYGVETLPNKDQVNLLKEILTRSSA